MAMLAKFIKSIEDTFHCHISFNDNSEDFARALALEHKRSFHSNSFCRLLGLADEKLYARCIECDLSMSYEKLRIAKHRCIRKYCHAGVLELVFPLYKDGLVAGLMFAGPFRLKTDMAMKGGSSTIEQRSSVLSDVWRRRALKLPAVDGSLLERLENIGILLGHEMERMLESSDFGDRSGKRPERIKRFFDHSFRKTVSLPDLAAHLDLSVPRASQLLRKYFSCGFPDILNAHRLDYAARKILNSKMPVVGIAKFVGYSSPTYFHRVFKRHYGMTPEQMREAGKAKLTLLSSVYGTASEEFYEGLSDQR